MFLIISPPHHIHRYFIRYAMRHAYVCTITLPMPINLFFARPNTSLSLENTLSTATFFRSLCLLALGICGIYSHLLQLLVLHHRNGVLCICLLHHMPRLQVTSRCQMDLCGIIVSLYYIRNGRTSYHACLPVQQLLQ